MSDKHVYSFELAGRPLTFEIGELAKQANASVLVRYGDTVDGQLIQTNKRVYLTYKLLLHILQIGRASCRERV